MKFDAWRKTRKLKLIEFIKIVKWLSWIGDMINWSHNFCRSFLWIFIEIFILHKSADFDTLMNLLAVSSRLNRILSISEYNYKVFSHIVLNYWHQTWTRWSLINSWRLAAQIHDKVIIFLIVKAHSIDVNRLRLMNLLFFYLYFTTKHLRKSFMKIFFNWFHSRVVHMSFCAEYYGNFRVHAELRTSSKSNNCPGWYDILNTIEWHQQH